METNPYEPPTTEPRDAERDRPPTIAKGGYRSNAHKLYHRVGVAWWVVVTIWFVVVLVQLLGVAIGS